LAFYTIVNQILEEKMIHELIESPIELTDDQLDMVAAAGGGFDPDVVDADVTVKDINVAILSAGIQH
jgi:hypothetical protein